MDSAMPSSHPLPASCHWFSRLASALDPRSAPRLAWLLVGAVLARGRRTVTSWIREAVAERRVPPVLYDRLGCRETDRPHGRSLGLQAVKPLVTKRPAAFGRIGDDVCDVPAVLV